jgi:hypothetical protein
MTILLEDFPISVNKDKINYKEFIFLLSEKNTLNDINEASISFD